MEGRSRTAFLGVDYGLSSSVVGGILLSRSKGNVDYESPLNGTGRLETDLSVLYPYVRWSPRREIDIWGTLGYGRGDAKLEDDGGTVETDIEMRLAALGANSHLAQLGAIQLSLNGDLFAVRTESDSTESLQAVTADATRVRLALGGSGGLDLSSSSRLEPSLELGARLDGGDAETGAGVEIGGRLAFSNSRLGVDMEASGRWLVVHQQEGFEDWGASFLFSVGSGARDRGLKLLFEPVWGQVTTDIDALWRGELASRYARAGLIDTAELPKWRPERVGMEVSYGLTLVGGRGLLVPFGQARTEGVGARLLRVGSRFVLDGGESDGAPGGGTSAFQLEVLGERRETLYETASSTVGLDISGTRTVAAGHLKPFGEFRLGNEVGRRARVGLKLVLPRFGAGTASRVPDGLGLNLYGEYADRTADGAGYQFGLSGNWRFH